MAEIRESPKPDMTEENECNFNELNGLVSSADPDNKSGSNAADHEDDQDGVNEPHNGIPYNPAISDDIQEDIEKIKGDAIGNTLYSSRFVLKTLIRLTNESATPDANNLLSKDEDFEKDLCTLWDMTIEKDVVLLLLEHNVLELFSTIIQASNDQRLTEILVGIIGNMCAVRQVRDTLCNSPDVMSALLDLVSCSDSLVLVQLMRLIHSTLIFENTGDELTWFRHFENNDGFVDQFAFILSSSMNSALLLNAFEALNAMCSKFAVIEIQPDVPHTSGFRDMFVKSVLVEGVVEAFRQMCPDQRSAIDDNSEMSAPSKTSMRIINLFLDINVALSQYSEISRRVFESKHAEMIDCIGQILDPLCSSVYLFPITMNEQGILENVNELVQSLGDIFNANNFGQMIKIWSLIDSNQDAAQTSEWEQTNEEEDISIDDLSVTILEFITRTSRQGTTVEVARAISDIEIDRVQKLYNALIAGESEPDIEECCAKLNAAALTNWKQELSSDLERNENNE